MFLKQNETQIAVARMEICKKCPSFNNNWCGKRLISTNITCGCYLPVKVVTRKTSCPQKKW